MDGHRRVTTLALLLIGAPLFAAEAKRPLPDYDGRPERSTPADTALWIPRVLFFPLYVTSDFFVRRPIGWAFSKAERKLRGDSGSSGGMPLAIVPTFTYESGRKASVGVFLLSDSFLSKHNALRAAVGFWGLDTLAFALRDRVTLGRVQLAAAASWSRRPDHIFHGLGPESRAADRARFHARHLELSFGAAVKPVRAVTVAASAGYRHVGFRDGACCDDPALADQIAAGVFPAPHGLDGGVRAWLQRLELNLDGGGSRAGVRLLGELEHAADPRAVADDWLRYGATVGAFVDLTGRARILELSLATRFVRSLSGEVPFTELIALGGDDLPGFLGGRLRGDSAFVATLRYRWPVWVWLRGVLAAELGNVFGPDRDGLDAGRLRLSLSGGIRSTGREAGFQILVGAGTEPMDAGAGVDEVRVVVGAFREF